MYKLIIEDDEGKTTVVPLIRDEITIGRKEGNTIRLTERNISRRHAKILKSNGAVLIEDLDSYNGIKINGARVNGRAAVGEGDRIQIGDYQLALKFDRQADTPTGQSQRGMQSVRDAASTAQTQPSIPVAPPPIPAGANGAGASAAQPAAPVSARRPMPAPQPAPEPSSSSSPTLVDEPAPAASEPTQRIDLARLQRDIRPAEPPRLVIVSTELAGRELVLDKGTMVIGRTDDNDIVIDHRSISRHHAKIVREGGRFSIVDLQSSNGVRVNGEDYGRVELRKGDVIDLGHVQMRFVEGGESWGDSGKTEIVSRSAVAGARKSGSRTTVVAVAVAAVAAVAAVIAVLAARKPTVVVQAAQTATAGAQPAAVPAGTAPAAGAPEAPLPPAAAAQLAQAERARDALDWDGAIAALKGVLAAAPQNATALDLLARAQAEKTSAATFGKYSRAAADGSWDLAVALYNSLPTESVYRGKADAQLAPVKRGFLQAHRAALREAVAAGDCATARKEQGAIETVEPGDADAAKLVGRCGTAVAAATPPANPRPITATPVREHPAAASPPATPACDATPLGESAKKAYMEKDYDTALHDGWAAIKCQGDKADAWLSIGLASCATQDGKTASRAMKNVDPGRAGFIKQTCDHYETELP